MRVTVRLFAVARQTAGRPEVVVELGDEMTVGALRAALVDAIPGLAQVLSHARIALNSEYADDGAVVSEGAEVAVIPPVSGGAPFQRSQQGDGR